MTRIDREARALGGYVQAAALHRSEGIFRLRDW